MGPRSSTRQALTALAALAATGLSLAPTGAGAQQSSGGSGGARVRPRVVAIDTTKRDSLIEIRVLGQYGGEVERLLREFAERRQAEFILLQRLRALQSAEGAGQATFEARRRQMAEELASLSREGAKLRDRLVSLCPPDTRPQGYMGISFSGAVQIHRQDDGQVSYRFLEDPVVESVELGSPAEAAGLRRGDRIVLLAGKEARDREIVFAQLLKPGTRLPIRIERDGRSRDVTLRVAQAPESSQQQCPWTDARFAAAFAGSPTWAGQGGQFSYSFQVEPPRASSGGQVAAGGFIRTPRPPRATPSAEAPPAPIPPDAPVSGTVVVSPTPAPLPPSAPSVAVVGLSARALVAGAELVRLNDGLRQALDVDRGVFVLEVARGTPAAQAGLRGGDVIVRVAGQPVSQPFVVQRLVSSADEREVPLDVVRERRRIRLVMRW